MLHVNTHTPFPLYILCIGSSYHHKDAQILRNLLRSYQLDRERFNWRDHAQQWLDPQITAQMPDALGWGRVLPKQMCVPADQEGQKHTWDSSWECTTTIPLRNEAYIWSRLLRRSWGSELPALHVQSLTEPGTPCLGKKYLFIDRKVFYAGSWGDEVSPSGISCKIMSCASWRHCLRYSWIPTLA